VSLAGLQLGLADALAVPGVLVSAWPPGTGAAAVALAVVALAPHRQVGQDAGSDEGDGVLRRVSRVTATVRVRVVVPGSTRELRDAALGVATRLWWRAEAPEIRTARHFGRDPQRGWAVEAVRPLALSADEVAGDGAWAAQLTLEVEARLWPVEPPGPAGPTIASVVVQQGHGEGEALELRVPVRGTVDLDFLVDARAHGYGAGVSASPRFQARLVGVDGQPVGGLAGAPAILDGGRVRVRYTAGAATGRDRLELWMAPSAGSGEGVRLAGVVLQVGG
jgi:hypothetical protein